MLEISVDSLSRAWGAIRAVDNISFSVTAGTFLVLLGPSGCGKSTTLRALAGLEPVDSGRICIDGVDVTDVPAAKRRISMVFQSYALFPHLSVAENIVFGLKVRRMPRAERERRLADVAKLVGLSDYLDRRPAQLSGGQRQRVALARAIVAENPVCLMDEPLSNLDAKLRAEMRTEIRALQRRLGMTVVYVTHDQTEALSMADRIILMRQGRIEQEGTPEELYDRPATTFVARFLGTPPMNLLELEDGPDGATVRGMPLAPSLLAGPGNGLTLGIRPEDLAFTDHGGLAGVAVSSDYHGADTVVEVRVGEQSLFVRTPGRAPVTTETPVRVSWSPDKIHLFETNTGNRKETGSLRIVA